MIASASPLHENPHEWVDTTRFPLVALTFPPNHGGKSMEALIFALARFGRELKQPILWLTDLTDAGVFDPSARQMFAQLDRDFRSYSTRWVRAGALVTPSAITRMAVSLHEALAGQPPFPQRLFFSRREAETWLQSQL